MPQLNLYEKNMNAMLENLNPSIEALKKAETEDWKDDVTFEEIDTASGDKSIRIEHSDKKLLLHSLYEPKKEAQKYCDKLNYTKDSLILVFGVGAGHHIFELYKRISRDSRIIVVEHHVNILRNALSNNDFSELIESGKMVFAAGKIEDIKKQLIFYLGHNMHYISSNVQIYALPNLDRIDYESNLEVVKFVRNYLRTNVYSFGNLIEDTVLGLKNSLMNIETIMQSERVEVLSEHYEGKPAIVVSAGPSLAKNMHFLKNAAGKALILACDASVKALLDIGVKPDAILSLERVEPTYNFFYKDKIYPEDVVLVGAQLLWPKIYKEYKGKKIVIQKPEEFSKWINKYTDNSLFDAGMSVATLSYAFARNIKCNPIILIGQDLAYTDGRRHSKETEYQKENEGTPAEIMIEGIDGEMLPSIEVFRLFRDWFERMALMYPETTLIDATEGGALIKGCTYMTFKEAIDKYCIQDIGYMLNDVVKPRIRTEQEKSDIISNIIKDLHERIELFKELERMAKKHMNTIKRIDTESDVLRCTEKKLRAMLQKLNYGDKVIKKIQSNENEVRTYFGQLIAQAVINVKKIDNLLEGKNVKRNMEIQFALMNYIKQVCGYLVNTYNEFIDMMEQNK